MKISDLKKLGYKVTVVHNRRMEFDWDSFDENGQYGQLILPKGGATNVVLEKDGRVYDGMALCSDKDNYCRATGRTVALARAMAKCEFLREKVPNLFL